MDEVVAEVVEEKVPEPKFEPFVVQYKHGEYGHSGATVFNTIEDAIDYAVYCRAEGYSARILRVQPPSPPKKQRVVIDMDAFIDEWNDLFEEVRPIPMRIWTMIRKHTSIVEVPNDA